MEQSDVPASPDTRFSSTADQRTANNLLRHNYRVLTAEERAQMQAIKDYGLDFVNVLHRVGGTVTPNGKTLTGETQHQATHELQMAEDRVREAVMWAVNHITR